MFLRKDSVLTDAVFLEAGYSKKPPVHVPGRSFSSLTFRRSGAITVTCRDRELFSGPLTLTFIPADCPYDTAIIEDGSMFILHFALSQPCGEAPLVITPKYPHFFANLFAHAVCCGNSSDTFTVMSYAYELLAEVRRELSCRGLPEEPKKLRLVREYIDENLCDSALRISLLAGMAGVSEVYFRKLFAKYYGMPPLAYIKQNRIRVAEQLLQTGLYSITETALRSGFDSVCYFSGEFRRMTGITPSEYIGKI